MVLSLVYYKCPMLCDLVLNGMLRAFRTISLDAGKDFEVVTFSFDPRETPAFASAKKANYIEKYGRHAELPDGTSLQRTRGRSSDGFGSGLSIAYDEKANQFVHASAIMVLTPDGRLSRYFYGVEFPPRDLRLGLVESSRIASETLSIKFCFSAFTTIRPPVSMDC